jgi:hypothetical protein
MTSELDQYVDIVFDGPPAPDGGRFLAVEDSSGQEVRIGEWIEEKGHWRLRIRAAEIRMAG